MARISGTGMNALELKANVQLNDYSPQNLNVEPKLPYADNSFDVVTCVVSVDYLIKPLEVFKEVRRVLKPGGRFIVSQSNRCFPTKAIRVSAGCLGQPRPCARLCALSCAPSARLMARAGLGN